MHRIDGSDHVAGMFSQGDPTVPRAPTQTTEAWLNALQEEIREVIVTLAGTALVKADNTQLRVALAKVFMRPGVNPSHGLTLPDGLLIAGATSAGGGTNSGQQRIIFKAEASGFGSGFWLTINAGWSIGSAQWSKDNSASPAVAMFLVAGALAGPVPFAGCSFYRFDGAGPWVDSAWTPINKAITLPYSASYADTGGGKSLGVYYGDVGGDVCIEGCTSNVAGAITDPIATLPAGFRPATEKRFASSYLNGTYLHCTVLISTAGVITTDAAVGAQVRLDGIRFRTV